MIKTYKLDLQKHYAKINGKDQIKVKREREFPLTPDLGK
jgi:hypothetical protein